MPLLHNGHAARYLRLITGFCLVAVGLLSAGTVRADLYKYQDESGSVCMTNDLNSVPSKYRKQVTVVREESPAQQKLLPPLKQKAEQNAPPTVATREQESVQPERTPAADRERYLKSALALCVTIAACWLVVRMAASVGYPGVGKVLFLAVVLFGGVYLYGLYVRELQSVFSSLRGNALNIKKNVEIREQKTDRLLMQMPEQVKEQQGN